MKAIKQSEATNYIERLLIERGYHIASRKLANRWVVFDYRGKQIGIDSASGIWVRGSESDDWRCFAAPYTVSGSIQAVEFLVT